MIIRIGLPETTGRLPIECEKLQAPALVSANRLWDCKRKKFRTPGMSINELDVALDSAGFSALKHHGKHRWRLDQYIELGCSYPWAWYAAMDYCCEPEVGDMPVITRLVFTLQMYHDSMRIVDRWRENCLKKHNFDNPYIRYPVPVIQGWVKFDYLTMIDWYGRHIFTDGKWPDMVAIGSVCRRNASSEIEDIVSTVLDNVPRNVKLHLFGVKGSTLKNLPADRIASIDSCAWDFSARMIARKSGRKNTIDLRAHEMKRWYEKNKVKSNVR